MHRGIWHSILAGLFSAAATAIVFYYPLVKPAGVAWLAAGFLFIGYLVHLTLDEMYSVDVMDTRIKSSFGTALKLFDRRHIHASGAMALATVAALWLAPSPREFIDGIASRDMWAGLNSRLLPGETWFGVVPVHGAVAETPAASAITTGSVPEGPKAPVANPVQTVAP